MKDEHRAPLHKNRVHLYKALYAASIGTLSDLRQTKAFESGNIFQVVSGHFEVFNTNHLEPARAGEAFDEVEGLKGTAV